MHAVVMGWTRKLCHKVEGDPHSLAPTISGVATQLSALHTLKGRIRTSKKQLGILEAEMSELYKTQETIFEFCKKNDYRDRFNLLRDKLFPEATNEVELLQKEATELKAKFLCLHLMCFYFSGKGLLLNRHRFTCFCMVILGVCLLLLNQTVAPAEVPQQEEGSADEEMSPSSAYVMLKQHCDYVPASAVGAYFDFWTIWLLITMYCMASTLFVFRHLLLYVLVHLLQKLWNLLILALGFVHGDLLATQSQKKRSKKDKRGYLDGITNWLEKQTGAAAAWFNHAQAVNEETDHIDKSTSTLMFMSGWVLASLCACHYLSQFQTPGNVQGDKLCFGAYVGSIALYKPIQIPMLQCVIKLLTVRLDVGKQKKKAIRAAFSLCGVMTAKRLSEWKFGGLIWGITLWYLIPMVMALPLLLVFAPATLPLVAFMLAPCAVLYTSTYLAGSLNRFLRIQGLPQHDELREYLKDNYADTKQGVKYQWRQLQRCTNTEFQRDAMPCIDLMRGFEINGIVPSAKRMSIHPKKTESVSPDSSNRKSSKVQPEINKARNGPSAGSIMQVLTREHPLNWQKVYENNSVGALLEAVKLQVLKVVVFGSFALLAYANLAFAQFYRMPEWTSVLAQASSGIRWPNISFIFDVSFHLPTLLMFDFQVEVRLFLYFGIALVLADELIKKFRVPFYAFNFRGYQHIYDLDSMPADAQESELCRRLQDVER
jgi:hypothetical protein